MTPGRPSPIGRSAGARVSAFAGIRDRAATRKGGAEALAILLPPPPDEAALRALPDDRVLSAMARRVFSAGFVWKVIEAKWNGFEDAFLGFDPVRLTFEPDEFWERLIRDPRIVRHAAKIMAMRANARLVRDLAAEHGTAARFLAEWPETDLVGLLELLTKRGTRLGGLTGMYLLRFLGKYSFVLNTDVVACLRDAGLEIGVNPGSKREMRMVQACFNAWAAETGLSLAHLSRICALSVGENRVAGEEM
jgi:3-methyladenine DNA glycosylase Tag